MFLLTVPFKYKKSHPNDTTGKLVQTLYFHPQVQLYTVMGANDQKSEDKEFQSPGGLPYFNSVTYLTIACHMQLLH